MIVNIMMILLWEPIHTASLNGFECTQKLEILSCKVVSTTWFCLGGQREDAILQLGYHDDAVIMWIKSYFSDIIVCVITWNIKYMVYKS